MGINKTFLKIQNQPLIEIALQLFKSVGIESILISGAVPGYAALSDHQSEMGPMGGIRTAYESSSAQSFLVLPVDMPALSKTALRKLLRASTKTAAAFENFPLPCLIHRCLTVERALVQSSVKSFLASCDAAILKPSEPKVFQNLNTPDDFEAFQMAQRVE